MKHNQHGFSPVLVIVALVVVGAIGYGGWYIFQKNNQKSAATEQTVSTKNTPSKKTTEDNPVDKPLHPTALEIGEWGIMIVPAESLPEVTYSLGVDGNGIERALFTFSDLGSECSGMYGMWRAKEDQKADDFGNTPEKIPYSKKIGEYYYFMQHGQAGCSNYEKQNALVKEMFGSPYSYDIQPVE